MISNVSLVKDTETNSCTVVISGIELHVDEAESFADYLAELQEHRRSDSELANLDEIAEDITEILAET